MNLADQRFIFDRVSERDGCVAVDGLIATDEFDLDNGRSFM